MGIKIDYLHGLEYKKIGPKNDWLRTMVPTHMALARRICLESFMGILPVFKKLL